MCVIIIIHINVLICNVCNVMKVMKVMYLLLINENININVIILI